MKKVTHLSTVHKAIDTRILYKECFSLSKKYQVSLIAKHPKNEVMHNVDIIPFPEFKSRMIRFLIAPILIFFRALKQRSDIYHIHDPELIFVAIFLKIFIRAKIIFDIHEHVKKFMYSKPYYIPKFIIKILSYLYSLNEKFLFRYFDGLIAATPIIKKEIDNFNDCVIIINNFPVIKKSYKSRQTIDKNNREICYVGNITRERGICDIIKALEFVDSVKFNLGGDYSPPKLRNELQQFKAWNKVNELGYLSRDEVYRIFERSVAGLIILKATPNNVNSYSNKLFEYMLAELPVIASNFPHWKKLIENNNCGICVQPKSTEEISEAIDYILKNPKKAINMGLNGRKLVKEKYNWFNEEKKLFQFYEKLFS